jgi:hypothetical protein
MGRQRRDTGSDSQATTLALLPSEIRAGGLNLDNTSFHMRTAKESTESSMEHKTYSFGARKIGRSLPEALSELGRLMWQAIQADEEIQELIFELADAKLSLDKVSLIETRLDSEHAEAIMGDLDPKTLEDRRSRVPPSEWLKYSLFNLALDWALDQALMRMKLEQKWPFQENDGFSKP